MYFKIRKADGKVIHRTPGPETCNKRHLTRDKNGVIDEVQCFALRKQPKCKNCWLANAIGTPAKRKRAET